VQIFTTVLGFGLWLGLVGIVDIRNSGPKSLFHVCFVCTLIFLVRPKAIACGADLSFTPDVLFFIFFPLAKSPRCVG